MTEQFAADQLALLKKRLRKAAKDGSVKSLRDAQRFVVRQ
jgi:hypothetical protein